MKHCPTCGATYGDDFDFCLQDGSLLNTQANQNPFPKANFGETPTVVSNAQTNAHAPGDGSKKFILIGFVAALFLILGIVGTLLFVKNRTNETASVSNTSANTTNSASVSNNSNASPTPTPTPTPNRAQMQKIINEKIRTILASESLEESDAKNRKIIHGDLDGDGDEDAAVHYIWNFIGGNGWGSSMMVLTVENGEYKFAADEAVGGKLTRNTELKSIRNGKIYLETSSYAEDDPACCPSIKGSTTYMLRGGKLTEAKK